MAQLEGRLSGKGALVTGGSRGIGRAISVRLARDGASVVVNYAGDEKRAAETVAAIVSAGGTAVAVQAKIGDIPATRTMVQAAIKQFGRLDILVNNASYFPPPKPLTETTEAEFDTVYNINARGIFFTMQEAVRVMSDGGRIINISSSITLYGEKNFIAYGGSRAAVESFSMSAARELGPRGITVNTVAPGPTDTELFRAAYPVGHDADIVKQSPLGRLGQPEDIADVVAFLASDDARWITGQRIRACGGVMTY